MIYLDHLLQATGGVLRYAGKQGRFDGFSHDTRQLLPGELFVAVRGEHSDGHDYLLDAAQRGASGLLIEGRALSGLSEQALVALEQAGVALIAVDDTRSALQHYARAILERWRPVVIAVTGSTGKTSTKEAIATILASHFATFRSWQNYNDLLGLPLSLGRLEERHEYAVIELGCDHPGEISELCRIAQPQIGVLTNISPTHLQYFGTLERLAAELGSLLSALPEEGYAVYNGDDPLVRPMTEQIRTRRASFNPSTAYDMQITWEGLSFRLDEAGRRPATGRRPAAPLHEKSGEASHALHNEAGRFSSRLLGAHHASTMLAACAVGQICGLRAEEMLPALANVGPLPGRLNPLAGVCGSRLLDDSHNAAPEAVIAGLRALRALPAGRRIAVLGDMLGLGDFEEEAHLLVGREATRRADYLVTRGERAALIADAAQRAGMPAARIVVTSTHEDAAKAARQVLEAMDNGQTDEKVADVILIKGSEGTRMERVTELLLADPVQAPERLVRQTPGWKQIVMMRAERPTWVEIDLSAIANNARRIKELVGPQVRVLASLKADAYGHGVLKVARTVLLNGVSMLGVATVSEAVPLREAGINVPILVFGYVPLWQMREAVRLDLTVTLYALEAAHALSRAALALRRIVKAHVKIDTGMGRLGIRAEQIDEVLAFMRAVRLLPGIEIEGLFTHFAMADTQEPLHAREQLARFQRVLHALEAEQLRPPLVHAANSAALLSLPEARFDMVRPGIALYGLDPSAEVRLPQGFRPALAFKTQVAQVKTIPAGEGISYGCTYVTERPTRVAVLPVGYADGFRRAPANWGVVLIHGQEAPILGRVCMDQCMIDVSHIPEVRMGDEVVLIGRQNGASLSAEQVAQRLGTINYEVVSEILARVPRVD
ncbi:MAG: alanine racemase [Ktedonobacteraceae bacterium]|nr:alanine racemase [Ktedonobacteraceae bacterium]